MTFPLLHLHYCRALSSSYYYYGPPASLSVHHKSSIPNKNMGNAESNAVDPSSTGTVANIGASIRGPAVSIASTRSQSQNNSSRQKVVTIKEDEYFMEPLKDEGNSDSWRKHSSSRRSNNKSATTSPSSSEGSSESVILPSLHGSLLRVHRKRDPLRIYEIVKVLGEGSMGSVSKVIKKSSAKGGSARRHFVQREKQRQWCFGFFDPDKCGRFNIFCPIKDEKDELQSSTSDLMIPFSSSSKSSDSTSDMEAIDENSSASGQDLLSVARNGAKYREARTKQYAKHKSSSIISYDIRDSFYALKSIHLDRCKDSVFRRELLNEIAILQKLDHPHIVRGIETFDFKDRYYLVLELCSGGDLYTRDPYSEAQALSIIHDVLDAVAYMHARGITHRDLKFENIMFSSPETDAVKVIDFGLSKKYSKQEQLRDTVGTVYTMAPEVLRGEYDQKCDVWSMGVIAFMLLSSSLPFYGKTRQHVVRKVLSGNYGFKGHRWKSISTEAKEFVMECLVSKAARRKSAEEMMKHPFLLKNTDMSRVGTIGFALMDRVLATTQTYCTYERVKKLALLVMAHKSTDADIGWLRKVFNVFDIAVDGEIHLHEFKETLKPYHYADDELERTFNGMDLDGTGKVHYTEFLAATLEAHGFISEERIAEAFDRLDSDDTGYITKSNIMDFLGNSISEDYANAIIQEADFYRDQRISYEEFLGLWNEQTDEDFHRALEDVNKRRVSFDDASVDDSVGVESIVTDTSGADSQDTSVAIQSADSSDLGGGSFFYGVEKEKSLRGVWV